MSAPIRWSCLGLVTVPVLLAAITLVAFQGRPRPAAAGDEYSAARATDNHPLPRQAPPSNASARGVPRNSPADHGRDVVSPAAGPGSTEFLTVAAANTPANKRALADYVCDGVHDEIEIQAALDSFGDYQTNPYGGVVQLMRGQYSIGAPISFRGARALRGEGVRGTVLTLAPGANCNMIEYLVLPTQTQKENFSYVEGLYLDGNKAANTAGCGIYTERYDPNRPGIHLGLWDTTIRDVNIMSFAEHGIYLEEVWGWVIDAVIIEFCGQHGLHLAMGSNGKICNCKLIQNNNAGLYCRGVTNLWMLNCEMDPGGPSSGEGAAYLIDCLGIQMTNCTLSAKYNYGLWLRGNTRNCSFVNIDVQAGSGTTTSAILSTYNGNAPYDNTFVGCDFSRTTIPVSDTTGRNNYSCNPGFVTEACCARSVYGTPGSPTVFTVAHGLTPQVPENMTRYFEIVPTNASMAELRYYVSNPNPDRSGTLVEITFLDPPAPREVLTFSVMAKLQRAD